MGVCSAERPPQPPVQLIHAVHSRPFLGALEHFDFGEGATLVGARTPPSRPLLQVGTYDRGLKSYYSPKVFSFFA